MCAFLSNFKTYYPIKPVSVKLSTGQHVYVIHSGTGKFNDKFYLVNILDILDFSFNLILVSKLTSSLNY